MIHALDHIRLAVNSLDEAASAYRVVLGRQIADGAVQLANVRLDFAASEEPQGLCGIAFAVADIGKAERLLKQRALPAERAGTAGTGSAALSIAPAATHGVRISLVARSPEAGLPPRSALDAAEESSAVSALDHLVIRSPNPERAIALYAGRLGLSLRLDRTEPAWGARLVFFRCGDLVVEVAHDLKTGVSDGPDRLWGLSWRTPDIVGAHARLRAAGVDISEIRQGRRPGTRICTVRGHTAGVPTLLIELGGPSNP